MMQSQQPSANNKGAAAMTSTSAIHRSLALSNEVDASTLAVAANPNNTVGTVKPSALSGGPYNNDNNNNNTKNEFDNVSNYSATSGKARQAEQNSKTLAKTKSGVEDDRCSSLSSSLSSPSCKDYCSLEGLRYLFRRCFTTPIVSGLLVFFSIVITATVVAVIMAVFTRKGATEMGEKMAQIMTDRTRESIMGMLSAGNRSSQALQWAIKAQPYAPVPIEDRSTGAGKWGKWHMPLAFAQNSLKGTRMVMMGFTDGSSAYWDIDAEGGTIAFSIIEVNTTDCTTLLCEDMSNPSLSNGTLYDRATADVIDFYSNPTRFDPRRQVWYTSVKGQLNELEFRWSRLRVSTMGGESVVNPESKYVSALSIIFPLHNRTHDEVGVAAVEMDIAEIETIVEQERPTDNSHILVIDKEGRVVATSTSRVNYFPEGCSPTHPELNNYSTSTYCLPTKETYAPARELRERGYFAIGDNVNPVGSGAGSGVQFLNLNGEDYWVAISDLSDEFKELGWSVVVLVPKRDVMSHIQSGIQWSVIVSVILVVVLLLLFSITIQLLHRPLGDVIAKLQSAAYLDDEDGEEAYGANSSFSSFEDHAEGDEEEEMTTIEADGTVTRIKKAKSSLIASVKKKNTNSPSSSTNSKSRSISALSDIASIQLAYWSMSDELRILKGYIPEHVRDQLVARRARERERYLKGGVGAGSFDGFQYAFGTSSPSPSSSSSRGGGLSKSSRRSTSSPSALSSSIVSGHSGGVFVLGGGGRDDNEMYADVDVTSADGFVGNPNTDNNGPHSNHRAGDETDDDTVFMTSSAIPPPKISDILDEGISPPTSEDETAGKSDDNNTNDANTKDAAAPSDFVLGLDGKPIAVPKDGVMIDTALLMPPSTVGGNGGSGDEVRSPGPNAHPNSIFTDGASDSDTAAKKKKREEEEAALAAERKRKLAAAAAAAIATANADGKDSTTAAAAPTEQKDSGLAIVLGEEIDEGVYGRSSADKYLSGADDMAVANEAEDETAVKLVLNAEDGAEFSAPAALVIVDDSEKKVAQLAPALTALSSPHHAVVTFSPSVVTTTKQDAKQKQQGPSSPTSPPTSPQSKGAGVVGFGALSSGENLLEERLVSVVVVNLIGFHSYAAATSCERIAQEHALVVNYIYEVAKRCGGVLDNFTGDRFWVSFNGAIDCEDGPIAAALFACEVISVINGEATKHHKLNQQALRRQRGGIGLPPLAQRPARFPAALRGATVGIATGKAHVGPLGSNKIRRHTIISSIVSEAAALEQLAGRYPDCGVVIADSMINAIEGYCQYLILDAILLPGSSGQRRRVASLKGPMMAEGCSYTKARLRHAKAFVNPLPKVNPYADANACFNAFLEGRVDEVRLLVAKLSFAVITANQRREEVRQKEAAEGAANSQAQAMLLANNPRKQRKQQKEKERERIANGGTAQLDPLLVGQLNEAECANVVFVTELLGSINGVVDGRTYKSPYGVLFEPR